MNAKQRAALASEQDGAGRLERLIRDNLNERLQFAENIGSLELQGAYLNALRSLDQAIEVWRMERGL